MIKKIYNKVKTARINYKINQAPFYQHFPYSSTVPPIVAETRGLIDVDNRFFYNRIPKAANSTITGVLASNTFETDIDSAEKAKTMFRYPKDLSHKEVEEFKRFFKFTFVRNPYTRTLSAFLDKIRHAKKLPRELEKKYGKNPSFLEFLYYLQNSGLYKDVHWAPQTSLLLIPIDDFDFIGKIETLREDLGYVLSQVFEEPRFPAQAKYNKHATGAAEKMEKYYGKKEEEIVSNLYRDDFEMFKYRP